MPSDPTESEMVHRSVCRLLEAGIEFATEVPFLHRSIDLVYRERGEVCAVEFKRADWRRALAQALDHALGADRAYVCLPKARISARLVDEARALGIGILGWVDSGQMSEEVSPGRPAQWAPGRAWLEEAFEARSRSGAC